MYVVVTMPSYHYRYVILAFIVLAIIVSICISCVLRYKYPERCKSARNGSGGFGGI